MNQLVISFFTILLLIFPSLIQALTSKVVSFADGDTITILEKTKTQHKIRLYGINTPKKTQSYGNAAKKYTSKMVYNKTVDVTAYMILINMDARWVLS